MRFQWGAAVVFGTLLVAGAACGPDAVGSKEDVGGEPVPCAELAHFTAPGLVVDAGGTPGSEQYPAD